MSATGAAWNAARTWWRTTAQRAQGRDVRRQLLYSRSRQAVLRSYLESRARGALPTLVREYLEKLAGTVVAFWIISALLSLVHARPAYTLLGFGLYYSLQATYYRFRLAADPEYRIPRCRCSAAAHDASELVLGSSAGALGQLPLAALGAVLYVALLGLLWAGHDRPALLLAGLAVAVSAVLAYVMVSRIRALCSTCINLAGLNLLILWQLFR